MILVKLEQPNVVAGECTSFTDVSKVYDEDHPALSLIRVRNHYLLIIKISEICFCLVTR